MDLFLDDPNNEVETDERNISKTIHIFGFIGSFIPPLNLILPFVYSKIKGTPSQFVKQHASNALNFQLLFFILILLGIGLYLFTDLFYVLMYLLFLVIFQLFYTYQAYTAAQSGKLNSYPISLKIF